MPGIDPPGIIADNGKCKFHTSGNSYFYQDFTNVPATDVYGDVHVRPVNLRVGSQFGDADQRYPNQH